MFDQRIACRRSAAAHDVDDPGGQSCFHERFDQVVDRERRIGGRLDDAGIAAYQRRKQLPRRNGHGKIPRGDHAHHAYRHADAHGELVLQLAGRGFAEQAAAFAGDVEGLIDGLLHIAAGLGQHFAHLPGHVARVFFLFLEQDVARAKQDFGTLGSRNQPPGSKCFFGGGYGQGHVFCVRRGELADDVGVVGRVHVGESLAAAGREPFAADQIAVFVVGHKRPRKAGFRGDRVSKSGPQSFRAAVRKPDR